MDSFLFTSESVTEGHPDKICDQISDAILDAYLEQYPDSRTAIECLVTKNKLIIAGEVLSKTRLDHSLIARQVISEIGYDKPSLGFHSGCEIEDLVHNQSLELVRNKGAGDQGLMFGYACSQTKELMPLPITIAQKLAKRLTEVRKKGLIQGLFPDGKTQATIRYEDNKPKYIENIILSTHHDERYLEEEFDTLKQLLKVKVINKILSAYQEHFDNDDQTILLINPNGPWSKCGGPAADVGLTGRKIISDTYGGWARHGGGAFSGKDASKVDRSAAYMARHIAKTIVSKNYANECEIQLGYAIGKACPVSLHVNTFNTERVSKEEIRNYVSKEYKLSVHAIIDHLHLKRPIYRPTSTYGHFGNNDFSWESLEFEHNQN